MKYRLAIIVFTLSTLLICTSACTGGSPSAATSPASSNSLDGAALVQERCTVCHPLSRVENYRFTAAEWKTVVDTMVSHGAQLSPDEESAVVNWLSTNYAP